LNLNDANLLAVSRQNELAVVMHGTHNGQLETVGGMLARAPLAGGSPKELLANVRWADWDAQGNLAVVNYVDGQSRLEYPIGKLLYKTDGWISNIRFSPQGDRIAFLNHPGLWDNRGTLCMIDLAGHLRTLTPEYESEQGLAWQANGKEIWFTAAEKGTDLNLMAVSLSAKVRTVLDLPMGITLQDMSPDGSVLVALNTKRLGMAFSKLGSKEDLELSWHDWNVAKDISPDGKSVLFEDASEAAGSSYAVALRKLDGTLPVRLGDGSAGGLSPDGKWAISISTGQPQRVTLLPIGPGQPRAVDVSGLEHVQSGWARFLSDGQRLIANGNEPGHATRCYVLNVAGGKPTATTPDGIMCGPPSPDSRFVVGIAPNSAAQIYPLGGGAPRTIPSLDSRFLPVQWSGDGSVLYGYNVGELPSRVYKLAINSGKQTVVQELRPGVPAGVVNVAPVQVSLDGTRFAYSYNQTMSVLYLISGLR
jgi:dipeptidyl aminopeptidase/acylaminoacyl peptidase